MFLLFYLPNVDRCLISNLQISYPPYLSFYTNDCSFKVLLFSQTSTTTSSLQKHICVSGIKRKVAICLTNALDSIVSKAFEISQDTTYGNLVYINFAFKYQICDLDSAMHTTDVEGFHHYDSATYAATIRVVFEWLLGSY